MDFSYAPNTLEAQAEGGSVTSLSSVLKHEITIAKGRTVQSNFDDCRIMKIDEMPKVGALIIPSTESLAASAKQGSLLLLLQSATPFLPRAAFASTG